LRAAHDSVRPAAQPLAPPGLDPRRVEQGRPRHPAGLRRGACRLTPCRVHPAPAVCHDRGEISRLAITEQERPTAGRQPLRDRMEDGVECIELALLAMVELAVEKGASVILMPVSSRKQLFDLSDDLATKITAVFYSDAREAFIKAIADA
jgi:hypothetical protein